MMMLASGSSSSAGAAALQTFARALSTSSAAAAAAPALASKPSSGGSFLSALGFGSARIDVPLSEALPTSVPPLKSTPVAAAPRLQTGALASSGVKAVAVDVAGPVSSVSLVVGAGSAFESEASLGASAVLEQLGFKGTTNRTTFRITRELEKIGAEATATAGRATLSYNLSAVKLHTPEVVELLLDAVLNPKLNYWEVQEAIAAAKAKLAKQVKDPRLVLADVLHRAAFDGSLGLPLYPDPAALDHVTKEGLHEFLASTLKPGNAVLAAAGVGLDAFSELAGPLVAASNAATGSSSAAPAAAATSGYVGGSLNVLAPSEPLAWVGLAFEAKGGLGDSKGAAAAAVAKVLLDASPSVLPHASQGEDLLAGSSGFSSLYKDTGLVGLVASSTPAQVGAVADAAAKKLEGLAKGVPEAQLKTAKQVVVGAFKAQLSSAPGLAAAAAPQLLLAGKFSPAEFVAAVEALSAADVAAFVSKGLKSSPTLVTYGSLSTKVPRYEAFAKRFA